MSELEFPDTRARDAKQLALRWLARREYSQHELEMRLRSKGFATDLVARVVVELQIAGSLSDERFAEAYVATRRRRGYGPQRIVKELDARGVSQDIIACAVNAANAHWLQEAGQVRRKRFGGGIPTDYQEKSRQAKFLNYRGFNEQQIKYALSGGSLDSMDFE